MGLLALAVIAKCNADLPFDDDAFETPPTTPTPIPAAEPTMLPISEVIGITEYCVIAILILYAIIFVVGRASMKKSLLKLSKSMEHFRNYFYVVPTRMQRITRHDFHSYITGRRGYLGGFITVSFSKRSDILGWIFDKITGRKTRIAFEFICEPETQSPAIFSLRHSLLKYQKEYQLQERKIDELGLTLYTDFGDAEKPFIDAILEYEKIRPKRIVSIDLNDCNRFETNVAGRFVARIEMEVSGRIEEFVDHQTIDFVMNICDNFNKLHLSDHTLDANVRQRATFISDQKLPRAKSGKSKKE